MPKYRVTFHTLNNIKIFKPAVVSSEDDLADLLKQANNRLKVKAKRLFLSSGEEITSDNVHRLIQTDALKIYVSKGEDFHLLLKGQSAAAPVSADGVSGKLPMGGGSLFMNMDR